MFWMILAILAILWLLGANFQIAGGLVHLLLVSALVIMIWKIFLRRPRSW